MSIVLPVVAIVSIALYYFIRIIFYVSAGYGFLDALFAGLLLFSESFIILHAFGFMLNAYKLRKQKKSFRMKNLDESGYPSVAVVVAAKHEPASVLDRTLCTLRALDYPNFSIYFLDGGTEERYVAQDRKLARKYSAHFFQSKKPHGAKAGILNDFIAQASEDYIAIFDADQNPMPDFLKETVAIAEHDRKIAFVQTPQFYTNFQASPMAQGAALQQAVFYESICEGKDVSNAMFCCGTNVLFRLDALRAVGGFDETSITEDFATSIKFHTRGYKSVYYNHARVFGLAPESLAAYFKQQYRWSAGTLGVFKKLLLAFVKKPKAMTLGQWWEYFLSSTYYLVGWAFFFLMLCPVVYLIFGIPTYFVEPQVYILTFLPYFALTLGVFYRIMKKRKYKFGEVYNGIILASVSYPVYMRAGLAALFGKKFRFQVTPKGRSGKIPFLKLWPWTLTLIVNAVALAFGLAKFESNPYAVGINMFWSGYHLFIISRVYHLNKINGSHSRYPI